MQFNCQCECGKRFKKIIEKPTIDQVARDMHDGFIYENCPEHENKQTEG